MKEPDGDRKRFFVYFATTRGMKFSPFHWVLIRLAQCVCMSPIVHCAFGDERHVLTSDISGVHLWPRDLFERKYPGLCKFVTVVGAPIHLTYLARVPERPLRIWPIVSRFARGGSGGWTEDCVCQTLLCLQVIGVPIPHYLLSPAAILRWLIEHGAKPCPIRRK
jgi:hypothetical protein